MSSDGKDELKPEDVKSLQERLQKEVDKEGKGEKVFLADETKTPAKPNERVMITITFVDQPDGTVGIKTAVVGRRPDGTLPPTPAAQVGVAMINRLTASVDSIMEEANNRHAEEIQRLQKMSPDEIKRDKRMSLHSKRLNKYGKAN